MEHPEQPLFTRRFDRLVYLAVGVLGVGLLSGASFAVWALWPANQAVGFQPEQPIPFPHDIMAGQLQIPCLYCHDGAEAGPVAGLPTVETCMNCHRFVQPRDDRGRLRVMISQFLPKYADPQTGQPRRPVIWTKVHDVSDFAYFDHSRHTVAARLTCQECHGPVETMRVVKRMASFKMGWCIDCHRKPPEAWRLANPPAVASAHPDSRGPRQCYSCHR